MAHLQPRPPRAPYLSVEEPVLGMSHTWTHTPCSLLCLVPSLSIVGLGPYSGLRVGALLLLAAGWPSPTWMNRVAWLLLGATTQTLSLWALLPLGPLVIGVHRAQRARLWGTGFAPGVV